MGSGDQSRPPSSDRSDVPVDLTRLLYKNCLSLLSSLVPYVAAIYLPGRNEELVSFTDDLGCLSLWGEGLKYGQLNDVFAESEDLRNTSLEILKSFAETLTDQLCCLLAASTRIEDDASILQQIVDIRKGAHDARRILHESASIDTESLELSPYLEDIGDVSEDTTTSSIDEVLEQIHCYVQSLMSLLPLIERLLRQINHAQPRRHGTEQRDVGELDH